MGRRRAPAREPGAAPAEPGADAGAGPRREPAWRRHAVWVAVAAAYLLVFPFFAAVNNPNENVRIYTTRAIVADGTFELGGVLRAWGPVGDKAVFEGRLYSSKAPGVSLLGVPVLAAQTALWKVAGAGAPSLRAATWALRVFAVALPLAAFLLVFARAVEARTGSPGARDLLTLGLGAGTMLYPNGLMFVGHALSAALLFGGFLAVAVDAAGARPRRLAAGGLLAGLAVVFEYQTLLGAVVVAIFAAVVHRRRVLPFVLGALAPAVLLGAYHAALFGSPFEFPYAHIDTPEYKEFHQAGFFGLGRPHARVLGSILFAPDYGLFLFSPFLAVGLVLALAGIVRGRAREEAVVVAITAALVLFLAGMSNWRGGWCAGGPRYIAAVVPFLAWGIALGWTQIAAPRLPLAAAVAGLVLASVFLCALSGAFFPHFPLQFDNPVFDLVLPLVAKGYAPYGLGWALGLRGLASWLPLALALGAAVGLALAGLPRRPVALGVALLVAAAYLGPLSQVGRRRFDEREATAYVKRVWEPGPLPGAPPPARRSDGVP